MFTHTLTYARDTLGIGCIRFKHAGIRKDRTKLFSMLTFFRRMSPYGVYAKHTLDIRVCVCGFLVFFVFVFSFNWLCQILCPVRVAKWVCRAPKFGIHCGTNRQDVLPFSVVEWT